MSLRLLISSLFLILAFGLLAQPYGNEWIQSEGYNKTYYKIRVTQEGIHRVDQSTLSAAGLNNVRGDEIVLYHDGAPVPVHVSSNGTFGANDFFEFYGRRNRGELDGQLYIDPDFQPNEQYSLFNDTAIYFLTFNSAPVNPTTKPRITDVPNNLTAVSPEPYFWYSARRNYVNQYSLGRPEIIFGTNFYNAEFDEGEGFVSSDFGNCNCPASIVTTLSTPAAYAAGPQAIARVTAIAKSVNNHRFQVFFNNNLQIDSSFSGFDLLRFAWNVSPGSIGATTTFESTGIASGVDRNNLAFVEMLYPRTFDLSNASTFVGTLPAGSGRRKLSISNFNDRGQGFVLYDLDNNVRVEVASPGAAPYQVELPAASGERNFFIRSRDAQDYVSIASLESVNFVNYNNLGDYLIISHKRLQVDTDGDGIDEVEEYRRYRDRIASTTGDFDARVVDIDQLYDQFAYGVKKHHAAIPNFIRWALNEWSPAVQPQYVLLIGKGREYDDMRNSASAYRGATIPPYGFPGSDNLYTAVGSNGIPLVPIGRISVDNANEVDIYLNKVEQYEANQSEFGDPYQSLSNKAWMKEVLHFGGGTGQVEQNRFKNYLGSYERTIEDTLFGGHVTSFYKTSTAPIQNVQSEVLKSRVDSGVSLITFFGHSAPGTFDISFDEPQNYTNFGKYPMIFSNGCFAGYIYNPGKGISEEFVLADGKGAIAFLSTTGLSLDVSLNSWASTFYRNLAYRRYGQTVGQLIVGTINDLYANNINIQDELTCHEMTLNGDPALILNQYDLPDYAIEPTSIYFDPPILNASRDSFDVFVVVTNLGKAIDDSIAVDVSRILLGIGGGNNDLDYRKFVPAPFFKDTVKFTMPTLVGGQGYGLNTFNISVEAERVIAELSESNNDLINQVTKSIISDDIFPVYPDEFSIVPNQPITLKASTADPFAPVKNYRFEIDTTELFNSPQLQTTTVQSPGGIVTWAPTVFYQDSMVYYWRVSKDSTINGSYNWNGSSFIFIDGEFPGWNQSHYYQFLKDNYANVFLDNDRVFKFVPDQKELDVTTGLADAVGGNLPYQQLGYDINSSNQHLFRMGGCGGTYGLVFAVIDPTTGLPMASVNAQVDNWGDDYGNYHCSDKYYLQYGFDFRTTGNTPAGHPIGGKWSDVIARFVDSIPNGHYVLVYSLNNPQYTNWDTTITNALLSLGAIDILQFTSGISSPAPYIFFGQKGNPGFSTTERLGTAFNQPITETILFTGSWNQGFMRSDLIGPASEWGSFHWDYFSLDANPAEDEQYVTIYGVRPGGTEDPLRVISSLDTTIQWIDAAQYPYIRLEAFLKDDVNRTPPQMDYWRVLFNPVPEAALNPNRYLSFYADTLFQGEKLQMTVAVENLTSLPMHPMLMKYSVIDASNRLDTFYMREDSLPGDDYILVDFELDVIASRFRGQNYLVIDANPEDDQPELTHFNNVGSLPFFVAGDEINPLLDVTFDGVRIFDGDIVSGKPNVLVNLRDENEYLRLTDTNIFDISVLFPDGTYKTLEQLDPAFMFYPADAQGENVARLEFSPVLDMDGDYELIVRDRDMSGNSSTFGEYRISFEVINESTVSNVLNYPNPFTSYTRFVFTLTGSRLPDYFKIQIMSVSGTVVRELTEADLGPLHIGRNITQYGWDGTDQYGAPLANGVYFYRVVTNIDGEQVEHRDNAAVDRYFEKGFGKMVLIR